MTIYTVQEKLDEMDKARQLYDLGVSEAIQDHTEFWKEYEALELAKRILSSKTAD